MSKHMLSIGCKGATKYQRCNKISYSQFNAANIDALTQQYLRLRLEKKGSYYNTLLRKCKH